MNQLHLAVILPHTLLFGGVKRFLELGNRFIRLGHTFTVFTPNGDKPAWFRYDGNIDTLTNINNYTFDALFITEIKFLNYLVSSTSKLKIFYHVLKSEKLHDVLQHKEIKIFVNSTNLYEYNLKKYKIDSFKAIGGINSALLQKPVVPKKNQDIVILTYGRLSRKRKGTRFVIKACEKIYKRNKNIKLILFDTPVDKKSENLIKNFHCKLPFEFIVNHPVEKNHELFRKADIFVSAEKNAGWANTCAEAMLYGLSVIATKSGSRDILFDRKTGLVVWRNSYSIKKAINTLIKNPELRFKLATDANRHIVDYSWENLADKILAYVRNHNVK